MKERVIAILLALVAIITAIAILSAYQEEDGQESVTFTSLSASDLSNEVIRLHILADDDTKEAQRIKLVVRDALLPYLNALTITAITKEEAINNLKEHCDDLEQIVLAVLKNEGVSYEPSVELITCYFPLRIYGSQTFLSEDAVIFPPGTYDTIEVRLGESTGHNWWCLAYPSLCFIDASYDYIPTESKEYLDVFSKLPKNKLNLLFYGGFSVLEEEGESEEVSIILGSRLYEFLVSLFQKEK